MSCDRSNILITLEYFWIVDFGAHTGAVPELSSRGSTLPSGTKEGHSNQREIVRDAPRLKRLDE
jgi:hypothetical protein